MGSFFLLSVLSSQREVPLFLYDNAFSRFQQCPQKRPLSALRRVSAIFPSSFIFFSFLPIGKIWEAFLLSFLFRYGNKEECNEKERKEKNKAFPCAEESYA